MLKIWGRNNSINVQKVLWMCGELELPFERIDAGMAFGVNNTPEYKAMNPNGLVPLIDDDGFMLWESHAIERPALKNLDAWYAHLCARPAFKQYCMLPLN